MDRYRRWAATLNLTEVAASTTVVGWLSVAALAAVLAGVPALVPALDRHFALNPWPALFVFVFAPPIDLLSMRLYERGGARQLVVFLSMAASVLVQLFCGLLVAYSSTFGAAIYSSLLVFTATYYGYLYRATTKHPYMTLGTLGALLVSALANHSGAHLAVLAVVVPAAIGGSLIVGTFAVGADERRAESLRLREALSARMLEDQSTRAEQLGAAVEQFSMWNHDMRNSMTVAVGNLTLLRRFKPPELQESHRAVLDSSVADLGRSLEMVATGLEKMRGVVRGSAQAPAAEKVEVTPVVEAVGTAARARFPQLELATPAKLPVSVFVRGGSVSLYRLLENLIVNAAEGDGQRGASAVTLSVGWKDGIAALEVFDDGPGFKAEQLEKPITGFETTKAQGTGLGLYTVERLVVASGGSVRRANRPEGGASIVVRLPCEMSA